MDGFKVLVAEKISKAGNPYTCLEIVFPNGYRKIVFLSESEKFLIK